MDVFLIENDELMKSYNDIWNEVSNILKTNLIANPSSKKSF